MEGKTQINYCATLLIINLKFLRETTLRYGFISCLSKLFVNYEFRRADKLKVDETETMNFEEPINWKSMKLKVDETETMNFEEPINWKSMKLKVDETESRWNWKSINWNYEFRRADKLKVDETESQ